MCSVASNQSQCQIAQAVFESGSMASKDSTQKATALRMLNLHLLAAHATRTNRKSLLCRVQAGAKKVSESWRICDDVSTQLCYVNRIVGCTSPCSHQCSLDIGSKPDL